MISRSCCRIAARRGRLDGTATAQVTATADLKSGERMSAQLDRPDSSRTASVKVGRARTADPRQRGGRHRFLVATVSRPTGQAQRLAGRRSCWRGSVRRQSPAQLTDIGGSSPLRVSFSTTSGGARPLVERRRRASSCRWPDSASATDTTAAATTTGSQRRGRDTCLAQQAWTSTGHHRATRRAALRSTPAVKSTSARDGNTKATPNGTRRVASGLVRCQTRRLVRSSGVSPMGSRS